MGCKNCKRFLLVHICVVGMVLDVELNLKKSYTIKQPVGAQTETKIKEKKLRVEDALNAIKASVEKDIVVGGGCPLLPLAVNGHINKEPLNNDEQKVGVDIVKRALGYPMNLIANSLFRAKCIFKSTSMKMVINLRHKEWKMYVIRGSADPAINSQGNQYTAPANADSIEVVMYRPFDYQKLKMWLETTDVEDMLILLRTYS